MLLYKNSRTFLLALVIWIPSSLFITFCVAVYNGHVTPYFPYVSYTGTFQPESCIFGQAMDVSGFLIIVVCYIRYCQLLSAISVDACEFERTKLLKYNSASLIVAVLSALGASIVGNFQANLSLDVHMVGAFLAFFCFIFYCWLQTYLSYKLRNALYYTKAIHNMRIFLSSLVTINLMFMMGFGYWARLKLTLKVEYFWKSGDAGYFEHAISAFNEWSQIIATTAYFLTLYPDFKNFKASNQEYMVLEFTADA